MFILASWINNQNFISLCIVGTEQFGISAEEVETNKKWKWIGKRKKEKNSWEKNIFKDTPYTYTYIYHTYRRQNKM